MFYASLSAFHCPLYTKMWHVPHFFLPYFFYFAASAHPPESRTTSKKLNFKFDPRRDHLYPAARRSFCLGKWAMAPTMPRANQKKKY